MRTIWSRLREWMKPDPLDQFSEADIRRAALDIVYPLPSCDDSFLGGTVDKCNKALSLVDEQRRKFADYQPTLMRREIMKWFDFAEGRILEERKDCQTQKHRIEMDAYNRKRAEEDKRRMAVHDVLRGVKS